jgi:cation:H+ antiporter
LVAVGLLLLGGVLLYFGAEWLVRGAAGLALALGVRPLVIGLTVVSYGTSAPELAVSVLAAIGGNSEIALGNVIGSNIANVGLILGLTALIAPPRTDGSMARRELPILLAATAALPIVLYDGKIGRSEGALFLLAAVLFTYVTFRWTGAKPAEPTDEPPATEALSRLALSGLVLLGLVVLFAGGKTFVDGAVELAFRLGMSERVVGLTIVAVGTSLPELAASLVAALRGHSELAVGNVVGSNIFNIFLILGAASLVNPIAGALAVVWLDLSVAGALALLATYSLRKGRSLGRSEGALYLASYAAFLVLLGASG